MNVLLCLNHSIEEYDLLGLLSRLGYRVASIGGYIDPRHPHDPKRPALDVDPVPEIRTAVDALGQFDNLGAAQARLPQVCLDWADVIIYDARLDRLFGQWDQIRPWMKAGGRIIWRTIGQSVEYNERSAAPFRAEGLEIVRYSPKERNIPGFAGEDALIRFHKDPAEWTGWTGENEVVLNIAQHDATPHARDPWLNWGFWEEATKDLPRVFAGPHTEKIGGLGALSLDDMKALLRSSRAYLYTGTQPASYTLGLIEAMMTGIPVVSIGPDRMRIFPYGPELFEGHELAQMSASAPEFVGEIVGSWFTYLDEAQRRSRALRQRAIELFGVEIIGRQWSAFLDGTTVEFSNARETVTA